MDNYQSKERPSRGKNQRKYTDNRNEEANNRKEPQNDQNINGPMPNKDDRVVARTGGRTSSPTQDPVLLSVIMPASGRWDPGKRATVPEQQVVVIDEYFQKQKKQQQEREKRKEKKLEDYQRSKTNGTEPIQPSKSWSAEMEEEDQRLQADPNNNKSRNKNIKNRNNNPPANFSMSSASQSIPEISKGDKPADEWSEAEVQKWLESHGWKQYASTFGKHNIDGFVLRRLTMTQLETDLKISSLGHRIHIHHELSNLFGKNRGRTEVQSVVQKNTYQQERQQSVPIELVQQEKQQSFPTEEKSDKSTEPQSFQNSNQVDDSANKRIPRNNRNNSKRGRQLYQRKPHNDFV